MATKKRKVKPVPEVNVKIAQLFEDVELRIEDGGLGICPAWHAWAKWMDRQGVSVLTAFSLGIRGADPP